MTRFIDNGNGTITDTLTGLMWEQGEGPLLDWQQALDRCRKLRLGGHRGWRLPTPAELCSIVDYGRKSPVRYPIFGAASNRYWSSTINADSPTTAWVVDFDDGYVFFNLRTNRYCVRAVI